ncbi:phosphotransferase enzyme family protein [Grosmannia clavigera kw1407]|uniref:protein-ribulosamine 3-kinase n=1 Tax=Grosmannia clavigera (strain kw1407 / UAMH 11150) TaxID=655863 RepID=F0XD32_GROCL|nr:phosphotransferase enzyme family protein [Grosmannia clavigera kw1407]EFX04593.1 phosphotransferase enzyme family protein [Grosmannia clavigera kw1407]
MVGADPAIVTALGLDPTMTTAHAHGGSGFSSTFRVTGHQVGTAKDVQYFIKTGTGPEAAVMFRGEFASLNAIADSVPLFCPRAHAHGPLQDRTSGYFLATEYLDLGRSSAGAGSGRSFASKLAEMHLKEATVQGPNGERFGFPVPTCCGATEQDNSWASSWADFYAECRLRHVLRVGLRNNGPDTGLAEAVERTATVVVPRLLRDSHLQRSMQRGGGDIAAVVVHGDLWDGNHGWGRIVRPDGSSDSEEVVYDPACVYGHSEYELGIMRMFGGFGRDFWSEYGQLVPKDEPVGEWEDRLQLYELYHHLNHFALFGGGYRSGAMSIMQKVLTKYG